MKITDFVPTITTGRASNPSLRITKAGGISISKGARELLNLGDGSTIVLSYDEENKKDWYIRPGKENSEPGAIRLRAQPKAKGYTGLVANNASLTNAIFKTLKTDLKSVSIPIIPEPLNVDGVKFYPLISSAIKK